VQQQQAAGSDHNSDQAADPQEEHPSERASKPAKKKWLACFVPRAFSR
jgi:hypothetical protein